ncbi:discoidin/SUN/FTP domain-containing protein [Vagococcus silagei]|uniref:Carbohydrate-binding protein n=1 Tax=Vagococcus silagei TaxID=2508885 RepID=A0A4V3TVC1_9ENTE|nr:discoidin domain-containing protein [Vagococcus silagei]THB62349.1 hypothetical protein ESZ54_00615 [Vagococcus silagei]
MLQLSLKNQDTIIAERKHEQETYLAFKNYEYQPGDTIELIVAQQDCFVWVQVDEAIEPSLIFVKNHRWTYDVVLEESLRQAYSPKAFAGKKHYLRAWFPTLKEVTSYRNLARNAHDQKDETGAYPHAFANVETRNDSTFFARNAIDGMLANEDHGPYPYQSWGINQRKDAEITIDFGREIEINQVAIVLRGDYPHDSYWTSVTLELSDGSEHVFETTDKLDRQFFTLPMTKVTWVKLKDLIKHEDESPFPALTQLEVYGRDRMFD